MIEIAQYECECCHKLFRSKERCQEHEEWHSKPISINGAEYKDDLSQPMAVYITLQNNAVYKYNNPVLIGIRVATESGSHE